MNIKSSILILVLILCNACSSLKSSKEASFEEKPDTTEKLHIYLLIGQSNMAGRASFTEGESMVIADTYLLNNNEQWEPAKNPLNKYSTIRKELSMQKMNPGYAFSKTILETNKNNAIGLVVNARGGSSITQWTKGSKYYTEAVRRTQIAKKSGVLKGIIWHQGETDYKDSQYLEKLSTLIKDLRNDFESADLPFVAGQINNVPLINEQIAKLPEAVNDSGSVSSKGLTTMDRWHFDAKSMEILGQRYALKMLEIQAKQNAVKNTIKLHP